MSTPARIKSTNTWRRASRQFATGRAQVEDYVEYGRKVVAQQANNVVAAVDAGKNAYAATTSTASPIDGQV